MKPTTASGEIPVGDEQEHNAGAGGAAKHTPGPWVCSRYQATTDTHHHAIFARASDDGRTVTVATVYPVGDDGQPQAESHQNARVIAAAPDLAEALAECLRIMGIYHKAGIPENAGHADACEMPRNCGHCVAVVQARAALEKAGVA